MNTNKNQSNNSEKSVAIFWDYENIPQGDIASDLFKFARQRGDFLILKAYSCQWNDKAKKHLEKQGFECIEVENNDKIKNAVDHFLEVDCGITIGQNGLLQTIILVTGDCYAQVLQQRLKQDNIKLVVFSRKKSYCKSLKKQAQEFYYIEELPDLVKNISSEIPSTESFISYEDAVKCLIEAIQTAVNSGKSATVCYLAKLMQDNPNFPNYKNVSSIRKPDGTKFYKFSKFLETLIDQGMIKKVNQEILLVQDLK
ncbi:NYN domain-containing protein [Limnoraphis robusta Tam1]|uniref:NYN domain-containing protein n=1 Tax=Limnoraphis robusta TaxID=1118279 RepID=UPI002B1F9305|nr:NYN domain-containing protein [Limnoraphis robusta]MEA5537629.1 NYN domain-containing protein [Limnoraphis robusta Tam1]